MSLSGVSLVFWVLGLVGHVALLFVLFWRHRAAQFPCFTALIASAVLKSLILLSVGRYGTEHAYLWTYFVVLVVDAALQCAVVYEVAFHVFRPLGAWAPDVRQALVWLGGISLAGAAAMTWLAAPGARLWAFLIVIKANFFFSVLLGELFLGMLVLAAAVGLPWKTHVARIAYGLGFYSLLDVLIEAGHTLFGAVYQAHLGDVLTTVRQVSYLATLVFWIVTLWQEAPEPRQMLEEMREQMRSLQARLAYDLYTIRNWRKS